MNQSSSRSIFDWLIFLVIHLVLIGGISYAGVAIYGHTLGAWVATSAIVAGFVSMYLFAKDVPGETLMKIWLGLAVALNAGYLVHNGARAIGVRAYNDAQIRKFEAGMAQAARTRSRAVARQLGLSAKDASALESVFDDGVSLIAAMLAFFELASAIVIFSVASKRSTKPEQGDVAPTGQTARVDYPSERSYRILSDGNRTEDVSQIWPAEVDPSGGAGEDDRRPKPMPPR